MRLGKRINHDKALSLFMIAASMSTGYFFTFLRYATIDCAGYNVPNGGACAVDVIASVFLAMLSGAGFLGVYYFGPWVVHNNPRRDENGTEIDYVNYAKHYVNLTHLAPEPLDYFDYGFYANASYEEAHHQELSINGQRVMSKVWGNASVGSYEFQLGKLPVSPAKRLASRVIRTLTGRDYNCNGYIRINKHYNTISPENPAFNSDRSKTLALDMVDYLISNEKDGGCLYADDTATGNRALFGFKAGCNAVNVAIPSCPDNPAEKDLDEIGYISLTKRVNPVVEDATVAERDSIGWGALCEDSGNIGQVCQCWEEHHVIPYSTCQKASCNYCNVDPVVPFCLNNFPSAC